MKRHFLFYLILILGVSVLSAQQSKIDSLNTALKTAKEDTNKVKCLNALSWDYCLKGQFEKADSLVKKAFHLDTLLAYKAGLLKSVKTLGSIYYMQDNYTGALKEYSKCLSIDQETGNKEDMISVYGNIGSIFNSQGNYPEALKNYLLSLKIAEQLGKKQQMARLDGNIGIIYYSQNNFSEALENDIKSISIFKEIKDSDGLATEYINLGNVYEALKDYSNALRSQQFSLDIYNKTGYSRGMGTVYENIGNIYYAEGNYKDALQAFLQAYRMFKNAEYKRGVGFAYMGAGSVYAKERDYASARVYLDSAIYIAKDIGEKEIARDAYHYRTALDSATSNYGAAFADYKNYVAYGDSLKNEENTKKLVSEQMQYEFDKKQGEEKAIQEKKDAENDAAAKRQLIVTGAVSTGLLLVTIFSGLLYSRFRVTRKQKKIIEEQKELVEEKNKEVLDSITYAKRLQDAILPPMSVVQKYLPESFVLYKPKDIVAGDFYWMEKAGDTILIAAADCTGHGVPGAMVSVVCSNALNRAVKEFKITEPGKILDKVRELVLETFEKSEGDIKDGMDISLLAISRQLSANSYEIQWAGAYNSLWYTENGEMKEIAADKQPIGKTDNPKPFTTHTITLNPPSEGREAGVLYLFTDGFADQFGGPKGKKYKYKQLEGKLLAISGQPVAEQKNMLEKELDNWKGALEQVDDVLIIGIRV